MISFAGRVFYHQNHSPSQHLHTQATSYVQATVNNFSATNSVPVKVEQSTFPNDSRIDFFSIKLEQNQLTSADTNVEIVPVKLEKDEPYPDDTKMESATVIFEKIEPSPDELNLEIVPVKLVKHITSSTNVMNVKNVENALLSQCI